MKAILSNSNNTRKLLLFEITKLLIAVLQKKEFIVSFVIIFFPAHFRSLYPRGDVAECLGLKVFKDTFWNYLNGWTSFVESVWIVHNSWHERAGLHASRCLWMCVVR